MIDHVNLETERLKARVQGFLIGPRGFAGYFEFNDVERGALAKERSIRPRSFREVEFDVFEVM